MKSTFIGRVRCVMAGTILSSLWLTSAAEARTIQVNTAGGPAFGKCSLTDAIRAANTNTAVRGCPAGDAAYYDLILLQANTTYQNYGSSLSITSPIIIRGVEDASGNLTSTIMGHHYSRPAVVPSDTACEAAAIYVGSSDSYLQSVLLVNDNPSDAVFSGVCNYSASFSIEDSAVGYYGNGFTNGAVVQDTGTQLALRNSTIQNNSGVTGSAGIASYGNAQVYVMDSVFYENSADADGGAIEIAGDDGYLSVSDSQFYYNSSSGRGGAVYVNPSSEFGFVTAYLSGSFLYQNSAQQGGGGIWLGPSYVELDATTFSGNVGDVTYAPAIRSLNTDSWVYGSVSCNQGSSVDYMTVLPWTNHSPPLAGDGTCTFP